MKTLVNTEHPFSTILMDAQPVFVGKDLPGEYKSSEYTKTMKPALCKIKMQAATNLDEMLLLAENGEWRENVKPKHAKDAQNGWYRYDTEFAVPVLDAKKTVDHYTVYGGTLLIRNDADGKSYLYDLLDVEKKKVISKTSFSAETHSEVTSPKPSTDSISTSDEKVNGKFQLKSATELEQEVRALENRNRVLTERVAKWRGELRRTETPSVRPSDVKKLGRRFLSEYGSSTAYSAIESDMLALGKALMADDVSMETLRPHARAAAEKIIDGVLVQSEIGGELLAIRDHLKNITLRAVHLHIQ